MKGKHLCTEISSIPAGEVDRGLIVHIRHRPFTAVGYSLRTMEVKFEMENSLTFPNASSSGGGGGLRCLPTHAQTHTYDLVLILVSILVSTRKASPPTVVSLSRDKTTRLHLLKASDASGTNARPRLSQSLKSGE